MLHVQVIAPAERTDAVVDLLTAEATVANVVVVPGAARDPVGDLVLFDLARENASTVIDELRRLEIHETGTITFHESGVQFSRAAKAAEVAAPGRPEDAVIWSTIEARAVTDSAMSWSFLVFLTLATLIASVGRYLDQPILIVGAMVVGPEFAPISAICFGLARRRWRVVPLSALTLVGGFAIAIAATMAFWAADRLLGGAASPSGDGSLTSFIVHPDGWSLVIAILAGIAGTLSMTAAKDSTLVGVFISVTTVPAAGTIALSLVTGVWHEAVSAAIQLGVNVAGMLLAGTLTLLVQRLIWEGVLGSRATGEPGDDRADS
jgi:uncharacterized hydrophobic protein (TIGR00271 family)